MMSPVVEQNPSVSSREMRLEASSDQSGVRLMPTPLLAGEFLSPHQDSSERQSSAVTSLWSLIATIIGGGVLALPFGFARTGIIAGTLTLVFAALLNDFSLDIIVAAARRTGSSTYEELALRSFGSTARVLTILIFAPMLWLIMVSYTIICADLLSPIITVFLPPNVISTGMLRVATKIGTICLIGPVCYSKTLNALKPMSLVSVISVLFLTISLIGRVAPVFNKAHSAVTWTAHGNMAIWIDPTRYKLQWWPNSISDFIYVFPTFMMALLCQYNVLPTHSELTFPTRQRMRLVNHITISFCTLLYLCIGLTGYLYSRDAVCANVFLNFDPRDVLITIGRVGLALAVAASIPLASLPCRQALLRLATICCMRCQEEDEDGLRAPLRQGDGFRQQQAARARFVESRDLSQKRSSSPAPPEMENTGSDEIGMIVTAEGNGGYCIEDDMGGIVGGLAPVADDAVAPTYPTNPPLGGNDDLDTSSLRQDGKQAIVATLLMCSVLGAALMLDNIMTVWSIAGASCSLAISFLLPSLFFLKVRRDQPFSWRKAVACFCIAGTLLVGSVATYTAVLHASDPTCPVQKPLTEKLPMLVTTPS